MITHFSTIPAVANEENTASKLQASKIEWQTYLTNISRHKV